MGLTTVMQACDFSPSFRSRRHVRWGHHPSACRGTYTRYLPIMLCYLMTIFSYIKSCTHHLILFCSTKTIYSYFGGNRIRIGHFYFARTRICNTEQNTWNRKPNTVAPFLLLHIKIFLRLSTQGNSSPYSTFCDWFLQSNLFLFGYNLNIYPFKQSCGSGTIEFGSRSRETREI